MKRKQRACNFNNVTLTRKCAKRKKKFSEQEKLAGAGVLALAAERIGGLSDDPLSSGEGLGLFGVIVGGRKRGWLPLGFRRLFDRWPCSVACGFPRTPTLPVAIPSSLGAVL